MYTFKTKVLGVEMEVTGSFLDGDYELNDSAGFEIDTLSHEESELEFEGLSDKVLNDICEAALIEAAAEAMRFDSQI